jgi:uncharacterized protein DUF4126
MLTSGSLSNVAGVAGAVAAGIALAACSGLRAFLPVFLVALAARVLHWPLAPQVAWLDSDIVLLALGVATAAEVAADKIPLLDHALDAVHTVLGPAAAVLASVSAWSHLAPQHAVLVALLAGAPVALGVHALSAVARVKTTVLSGGAANPALSVGEDAVTVAGVSLAVLAPIVLAVVLAFVLALLSVWAVRSASKTRRRQLEVSSPNRGQ